jgi:hypothetical protein
MICAVACVVSFLAGYALCAWIDRKHYAKSMPKGEAWDHIKQELDKQDDKRT